MKKITIVLLFVTSVCLLSGLQAWENGENDAALKYMLLFDGFVMFIGEFVSYMK